MGGGIRLFAFAEGKAATGEWAAKGRGELGQPLKERSGKLEASVCFGSFGMDS